MRKIVTYIHVYAISMGSSRGLLVAGPLRIPCRLGRSGRSQHKREGDGATPVGCWRLLDVCYRGDRRLPPRSGLPARRIGIDAGWCDAVGDRNYNRAVRLPYGASHEEMRRSDRLYDIVVTLSHNRSPRIQGGGSAVFFHLAGKAPRPTAGCVAVAARDMMKVLELCGRETRIVIWSPSGPPPGVRRKSPIPPAHGSHRI